MIVLCYIISPKEEQETTFNSQMMRMFGAEITVVSVDDVHKTIEDKIKQLMIEGKRPYFIEGGGHGNLGTEAYFQCYQEIRKQEKEMGVFFDYIFLASGTGTTQAGLVCGKLVYHDNRKIVGISIARKNPRGRSVVKDSIVSYLNNRIPSNHIEESLIFLDDYTEGYGQKDIKVDITINEMLKTFGIPLDATYTGKAFWGMDSYLTEIFEKNILFLHTGGTPLFFDYLRGITE